MINIIFLAPPAAGKGTQSDFLKQRYNIPHISTGELLREETKKGSEIGQKINEIMISGKLVSDDIVINLVKNRLSMPDTKEGYILDGFPRNINQAIALDKMLEELGKPINYVFYLTIDKDLALKRTCGRATCTNCGQIYNLKFPETMPSKPMTCDECGSPLFVRQDDNEETFLKRFDTYISETEPVSTYYKNKKLLFYVNSGINKDITFNQIISAIDVPEIK